MAEIGITFGIAVVVGAGLAALTVPAACKRFGRRPILILTAFGYLPSAAMFIVLSSFELSLVVVCIALVWVMFVSTAVWILVMEARLSWASQRQAATDFSAQASCASLGEWIGASVAGFVVASLGWTWFFNVGWTLSILAFVAFIWVLRPIENFVSVRS